MKKLALVVAALFFSVSAQAATFDFTTGSVTGPLELIEHGITVNVDGGPLLRAGDHVDHGLCQAALGLTCDFDGLGIGDDEIGSDTESITVTFSETVNVETVSLLDLFNKSDGSAGEVATLTFELADGSTIVETVAAVESLGAWDSIGYAMFNSFIGGVDRITLTAQSLFGDQGNSDYALAGIQVSAVPLPGAAWLMLSGLGAIVARRRFAKS